MLVQILWLLSWPVLIIFSYFVIRIVLKKIEDKLTE